MVNESIPLLYIPCSLCRRVISSNDISGVKSFYRALHLDAISTICDVLVWKMMRNANIYFVFLDKISMTRVEHTHAHTLRRRGNLYEFVATGPRSRVKPHSSCRVNTLRQRRNGGHFRGHFRFVFLKNSFLFWYNFHWNLFSLSNVQQATFGWDNALALSRRQAIIWTYFCDAYMRTRSRWGKMVREPISCRGQAISGTTAEPLLYVPGPQEDDMLMGGQTRGLKLRIYQ